MELNQSSSPARASEELLHGRPVADEEDVLQVLGTQADPGPSHGAFGALEPPGDVCSFKWVC